MKLPLPVALTTLAALFAGSLLLSSSSASAAPVAAPQEGPDEPDGSWELKQPNGAPVNNNFTVGADITWVSPGVYQIQPWAQAPGGQKIPLLNETGLLERLGDTDNYIYTNAAGRTGLFYWNAAANRYESVMLDGPNAGTERIFERI